VPTREAFHAELAGLERDIVGLAVDVKERIARAMQALAAGDAAAGEALVAGDRAIDAREMDLEHRCLRLLALQQPVAGDLRTIGAAWRILIDLERIADHAASIARTAVRLARDGSGPGPEGPEISPDGWEVLPHMAEIVQDMVARAVDAYVRRDAQAARELAAVDDEVDHLFSGLFRQLVAEMGRRPDLVHRDTHLLFVASHLERIADHATNVAEAVIYAVTGQRPELND
jgi:phosphate transport system protein